MRYLLFAALLCGFPALAQVPGGGGVRVGDPITGTCQTGYVLYSNAQRIGCETPPGGPLTVNSTTIGGGGANHALIDDGTKLQELPYGTTGNSTLVETDGGGKIATSILPDLGVASATSLNGWTPNYIVYPSSTPTPATAGTSNVVGDVLTATGGTCTTEPTFVVATVSGGGVLTYAISGYGRCATPPTNPVTLTSSNGGATPPTLTLTWGPPFAGQVMGGLLLGNLGNLYLSVESPQSGLYGSENTFVGDRAGGAFTGASSFNTISGHNAAGTGGASPFTGSNNTVSGTDAARNVKALSNSTLVGTSALKTQTNSGGDQFTAFGYATLTNLNSGFSPNNSAAFGINACRGNTTGTVNFRSILCLGTNTGAVLNGATFSTLIGTGVGNGTFSTGTGVILIGSGAVTVDTPAAGTANWLNIENAVYHITTAPTISSGFGSSPSVVSGTSDAAFTVNVGTGGTASSGVIAFATAAPHGWACDVVDSTTNSSTVFATKSVPTSTTTSTFTNYNTSGAAAAWVASDVLVAKCSGY